MIGDRLGWVIMEAPASLVFATCFWVGGDARTLTALVFLLMWQVHYVHRAFIYPLGIRGQRGRMPVVVVAMAFLFNAVNGYLNGRYLFAFSGGYPQVWLSDPRFLIGLGVYVAGYLINRQADLTLRKLRQPGESGYKIPDGGLYRWVSCPNYLGEIVEWIGWTIATWSLPGLAFAIWVIANLVPRAYVHHRWYQKHFPDYPHQRKALVPGLW
jgi:protein-S-isoprenylcysteine O-methyltransferase Ste14